MSRIDDLGQSWLDGTAPASDRNRLLSVLRVNNSFRASLRSEARLHALLHAACSDEAPLLADIVASIRTLSPLPRRRPWQTWVPFGLAGIMATLTMFWWWLKEDALRAPAMIDHGRPTYAVRAEAEAIAARAQSLVAWNGRLWIGGGDIQRNPGPCFLSSWNPHTQQFKDHGHAETEEIGRFRIIDGALWFPYVDTRLSEQQISLGRCTSDGKLELRQGSIPVHAGGRILADLIEHQGSLWVCTNFGQLWRGTIDGRTWRLSGHLDGSHPASGFMIVAGRLLLAGWGQGEAAVGVWDGTSLTPQHVPFAAALPPASSTTWMGIDGSIDDGQQAVFLVRRSKRLRGDDETFVCSLRLTENGRYLVQNLTPTGLRPRALLADPHGAWLLASSHGVDGHLAVVLRLERTHQRFNPVWSQEHLPAPPLGFAFLGGRCYIGLDRAAELGGRSGHLVSWPASDWGPQVESLAQPAHP